MRTLDFPAWILSLSIGVMFVAAGVIKLRNPESFAASIATFQLLPASLISLVAVGIPICEITVGAMLLFGWRRPLAAFSASALLVLFSCVLGQALFRGIKIDCGCFGYEEPAPWRNWASFIRDVSLVILTSWLYFRLRFISEAARSGSANALGIPG